MPLYEYDCKKCHEVVELLVRSEKETIKCPECGSQRLERLLSVPSAPSVKGGGNLPISGAGDSCGAPRCCGGGCQT